MAASIDPATRKNVLKVVFISLLLDLVCLMRPPALHLQGLISIADLLYVYSTPLPQTP